MLTESQRIEKWNKDRKLLDIPFNTNTAIKNILEELNEFKSQMDSKEARECAEMQMEDIIGDHNLAEPTTPEQKIDALCDIIVFAKGEILRLGYDPITAMDETLKEIESRKGEIIDGKFIKFTDEVHKKQWYKAQYHLAFRKNIS